MSQYKGRLGWIPADVMTDLYAGNDPTRPLAEMLRERLGLPHSEPAVVAEKVHRRFDVMFLNVGDSIGFEDVAAETLQKHIKAQTKGTGRQFHLAVTNKDIQVTRIK